LQGSLSNHLQAEVFLKGIEIAVVVKKRKGTFEQKIAIQHAIVSTITGMRSFVPHRIKIRPDERPANRYLAVGELMAAFLLTSDRRMTYSYRHSTGGVIPQQRKRDVLQGTLDLLILKILEREPGHGYGIMGRLQQLTSGVFQVTPGSLFPSLQRMEENGWVKGTWKASENNRRAKYYSITASGRKQLAREQQNWDAITLAITRVLENA
jgi:transcriptional regulator